MTNYSQVLTHYLISNQWTPVIYSIWGSRSQVFSHSIQLQLRVENKELITVCGLICMNILQANFEWKRGELKYNSELFALL